MSRIRSVHPGFFKDENLVATSMAARMFYLGLGVEADDKGVFPWKPVTLKMCIFPGDNIDVEPLLDELIGADAILRFEIGGKPYGAIRNFRKFQKPKTPNDVHPISPEVRNYVGLPPVISEAFPQNGEKSFQMEEGGGKREEKKESPPSPPGGGAVSFSDLLKAYPLSVHTDEAKAERAWSKLAPADQLLAISQAKAEGKASADDRAKRNRSAEAHAEFIKGLDKWLREGCFRKQRESRAAFVPDPDLVVLKQDDPLCAAISELRGKPLVFGTRGTVTVRKSEIEQARAKVAA